MFGSQGMWELQCVGVAVCLRVSQRVGVVVHGSCVVWGLRYMAVAVFGICGDKVVECWRGGAWE